MRAVDLKHVMFSVFRISLVWGVANYVIKIQIAEGIKLNDDLDDDARDLKLVKTSMFLDVFNMRRFVKNYV